MTASSVPIIDTPRMRLLPPHKDFARDVFAYASDPEFCAYIGGSPHQTEEQSAEFLSMLSADNAAGRRMYWVVCERESGRAIGTLGLIFLGARQHNVADLGYGIAPQWWGTGVFQEVGRAVIEHAFGPAGLDRLQAFTRADNFASIRGVEKLGFRREGRLRSFYQTADRRIDAVVLGLPREAWVEAGGRDRSAEGREGCIFCRIVAHEDPAAVIHEEEQVLAIMDAHPINRGHALVVPKTHALGWRRADEGIVAVCAQLARRLAAAATEEFGAAGALLLQSSGFGAMEHPHIHVIPRYRGDSIDMNWGASRGNSAELSALAARLGLRLKSTTLDSVNGDNS